MPCIHKFFKDINHLPGEDGLIPNWVFDTLFVGTFNPSLEWNINNDVAYYYDRSKNYFCRLLDSFMSNQTLFHQ